MLRVFVYSEIYSTSPFITKEVPSPEKCTQMGQGQAQELVFLPHVSYHMYENSVT